MGGDRGLGELPFSPTVPEMSVTAAPVAPQVRGGGGRGGCLCYFSASLGARRLLEGTQVPAPLTHDCKLKCLQGPGRYKGE